MALGLAIINVQTHQVEEDACTYVVGLRSQSWRCPMTTDIKTDWFASIAKFQEANDLNQLYAHRRSFIYAFERARNSRAPKLSPYLDVWISPHIVTSRAELDQMKVDDLFDWQLLFVR